MGAESGAAAALRSHANIRNGSSICSVSIEWGNGGASVAGEYPVIKRLRVPLVASMVKLSGRLVAPDGSPPLATDAADVSAFIATGLDGETLRNTRWLHQTGAVGTLASGPQRVMRIRAFLARVTTVAGSLPA